MNTLTLQDVFALVAAKRKYVETKVSDGIRFKLRKQVSKADVEELVSEVQTNMLVRLSEGKISFENEAKVIGYLLSGCWFNYRSRFIKSTKKKVVMEEDWLVEGKQFEDYSRVRESCLSLDEVPELEEIAEVEEQEQSTEQDRADSYYATYFEKVFTYLEDTVADGELKFRDVGIFKQYVLNGYTMKELVANSDFSFDICKNSVELVRKHLRQVDFRMK